MIIFFAILAIFLMVEPASAAPVAAAIIGAVKAIAAWKIGTFAIGAFLLKTAASFAVSALVAAKAKQKTQQGGIRTEATLSGEETSGSIILGKYATGGCMVCPPMTDGFASKIDNIYLFYVIDLGDAPIQSLDGIWIGDTKPEILPPAGYGEFPTFHRLGGEYLNEAWFKFYDGTQTTVDPILLGTDGNGRPWSDDMIGRGIPYVIMAFRFNRDLYQGLPECMFEASGIGLYDPRKDSSVGGSGPHRWGQPETFEPSENPAVQVYNILRGIRLPDGLIWGGEAEAEDLPLDSWFAEMNQADEDLNGKPRWRSSFEVKIGPEALGGDMPADVIETILRGCSGQIAEAGGVYKMRLGGPRLPVMAFTDEDVIISQDQQYRPFKSLQETFNGIQAQYPEPRELWANKEAPPRFNAEWEIEDGNRRLVASLALPATPYPAQVQRVMAAYIKDARRDRVVDVPLPPDYGALECLDSVAYTSELNGFTGKVFEVTSRSEDLQTLIQQVGARERDGGDYSWTPDQELPSSVGNPTTSRPPTTTRTVLDFTVEPTSTLDADGITRRAGIRMLWNGDQPDARGLRYVIRQVGQTATFGGSVNAIEDGEHSHFENVLGNTDYEVRAKLISSRATIWTGWLPVRTGGAGFTWADFTDALRQELQDAFAAAQAAATDIIAAEEALAALRLEFDNATAALDAAMDQARLDIDATRLELGQAKADLDADIAQARSDLQANIDAASALAMDNLDLAKAYTDTGILSEKAERVTANQALVARIDSLTAVLNSDNLLANPQFLDGLDGWTGYTASATAVVAKDTASADPVVRDAPAPAFVELTGNATTARVLQQTFDLAWNAGEVVQWKVRGAARVAVNAQARIFWLDAAGAQIGTVVTFPMALKANLWGWFSGQESPQTGAVKMRFELRLPPTTVTQPIAFTEAAVSTLDLSVLARIEELELVVAERDEAFTLYQSEALSRFDANEAAITSEASTRADADSAMAGTISGVTASLGTKNRTYRQTTAPAAAGLVAGDLWFDSDDNNRAYRWTGSAWTETTDPRIAGTAAAVTSESVARADADGALGLRIDAVEATADEAAAAVVSEATARADADSAMAGTITSLTSTVNSKNRTFRQASAPGATGLVGGDLWFDSDDSNKPYRWTGSAWVETTDPRIAQNAAAITSEATTRATELGALAEKVDQISVVASGGNNNYRQASAPTGSALKVGDLWYDSDDGNKVYRWNGSAWVETTDTRIGVNQTNITNEVTARADADLALGGRIDSVSAIANARNRSFRQNSAPGATGLVSGDLWFDSDDGNKPYRWTGSAWAETSDTRIAGNAADISEEIIARAAADSSLAGRITKVDAKYEQGLASGNLLANGNFASGDFDGWSSVPAQMTLVARNVASSTNAIKTAPTPFILQVSADGAERTAVGLQNAIVEPGERLLIKARVAAGGTSVNAVWRLYVVYRRLDGTEFGTTVRDVTVTSSTWKSTAFAPLVVPADAVMLSYFAIRRMSGAVGTTYIADVRLERESGFDALSAASITEEQAARADAVKAVADNLTLVQASVNSKNRTFRQASAPGAAGLTAGDVWYDSDDNNRVYRWTGSAWAETTDPRIASSAASVTTQGTAIASLQNGAAAGYLIKAQAGGAVSLIDLVAANNPTKGPTSFLKIKADDIFIEGSVGMNHLVVHDGSANMVPDPSWMRQSFAGWTGNGVNAVDMQIIETADLPHTTVRDNAPAQHCLYLLNHKGRGNMVLLGTRFKVSAGERFRVAYDLAIPGTISAYHRFTVRLVVYNRLNQAMAYPGLTQSNAAQTWSHYEADFVIPVGGVSAAIQIVSWDDADMITWAAVTNLELFRKQSGATLITPDGITTDLVSAATMKALNGRFVSLAAAGIKVGSAEIGTAEIEELSVNRLRIADRSVLVMEDAFTATGVSTSMSGWVNIQTLTFSKGRADPIPIFYRANYGGKLTLRLLRNGTVVDQSTGEGGEAGGFTFTFIDTWTGTGAVTYTVQAITYAWTRMGQSGSEYGTWYEWVRTAATVSQRFIGAINAFK